MGSRCVDYDYLVRTFSEEIIMKTYYVYVPTQSYTVYTVLAVDEDEAKQMVLEGFGELCDNGVDADMDSDSNNWFVEE